MTLAEINLGTSRMALPQPSYKERSTWSLVKGRRSNLVRTHTPSGVQRKGGDITGLGILPGDWGVQATYQPLQPWGLTPGRRAPFAGLKTSRAYQLIEIETPLLKTTCVDLLTLRHRMRTADWKLPGALAGFPALPQCTHQPASGSGSSPSCSGAASHKGGGHCCQWQRTLGGNGASMVAGPASDQSRGSHCQSMHWCTHSGGSNTSSSSKAETATTRACITVHT